MWWNSPNRKRAFSKNWNFAWPPGALALAMTLALILTPNASAQETPPAPTPYPSSEGRPREVRTGFLFNSPLALSAVREERLQVGQRRFNDDVLLLTAPELAFRSSTSRSDVYAGYQAEGQLFKRNNQLHSLDHNANFRATRWSTPRLVFDISGSFLQTEDLSRSSKDSAFALPRSQFLENTFRFSADYDLSYATTLTPSFQNTVAKLLLPEVRETEEFTGRFEQMGNAVGLGLTHRLNPRHQVTGGYTFLVIQNLKRGFRLPTADGAEAQSAHAFSAGYRYEQEEQGIAFNLSAGVLASRSATYRAAASFEKRWSSFIFIAGVSREISMLSGTAGAASVATARPGAGVLPGNFYELARVALRGDVVKRFGIDLSASVGRNNNGLQLQNIESAGGRLRVSYRATNRIYPFVGADITSQSHSELLMTSLARRRYLAGVSFVLSRAEEWQGGEIRKTNEWPQNPSPDSTGKGDRGTTQQGGL